jgi:hypothetical protein
MHLIIREEDDEEEETKIILTHSQRPREAPPLQ